MSKFIERYERVKCLESPKTEYVNLFGVLDIWESERLMKGKRFVDFSTDTCRYLKTSPGDITIENDILTIVTHNGEHVYKFKIYKKHLTLI